MLDPGGNLVQLFQAGLTVALATLLVDVNQPALHEDAHMAGNGGAADLEVLRNPAKGEGLAGQQAEDSPAVGVGNGLKNVSSHW